MAPNRRILGYSDKYSGPKQTRKVCTLYRGRLVTSCFADTRPLGGGWVSELVQAAAPKSLVRDSHLATCPNNGIFRPLGDMSEKAVILMQIGIAPMAPKHVNLAELTTRA